MASSPVGPSSPNALWPKARARSMSAEAAASDVAQANSDAGNQIARAQQAVQQAQNEADTQLEHIQDGFNQEESNQTEKNQEALEKQRLKGYEELRDLKLRQQAEYSRVRREGERELKQTTDYYRDTQYNSSRHNEDTLRQQQAQAARQMQYFQRTGQSDLTAENQEESRKMEILRGLHQKQIADLTKADSDEFERMKTNSQLTRQQETAKFQKQFDSVVQTDRQALDHLQNNASRELHEIRQDTSQKLAAYTSRQSDPFYKMMDIGASLHDRGDSYVLTARVPPGEQEHVSAKVSGNTLVISGTRRNEEHLALGPGRTRGTSSYQSYEESFPLPWPVDRNQLTKEFQGDRVIITVPKLAQNEIRESYKPSSPERVHAERPDFPGNLPVPEELASDENPGGPGHRPISGHTLS